MSKTMIYHGSKDEKYDLPPPDYKEAITEGESSASMLTDQPDRYQVTKQEYPRGFAENHYII
jgi:hypothetical protein